MSESAKIKQSIESFKAYLTEALRGKTAILLAIDKNVYLQGVVNIVQEVTKGMLPLFIGRNPMETAKIVEVLKATKADYLTIVENKHNLTDDEPRGEQLVFDWEVNVGGVLSGVQIATSYSLVGKIRHRGLQL